MATKKFYCCYARDDRDHRSFNEDEIDLFEVHARKARLLEIIKEQGWEERPTYWMDYIHYVAMEVPDQRDQLIPMTAENGPLAKEGFSFTWDAVFGAPRAPEDRDMCDGCGRLSYQSLEENDLFLKYEHEQRLDACRYVSIVSGVRENSRWGGVLSHWKGVTRSFWRAKLLADTLTLDQCYCEACVDSMIAAGDLVAVIDACSGCGDYHTPVTCQICRSEHPCCTPIKSDNMTQGDSCASNAFEHNSKWFIGCGYGSKFDMNIYEVMDPAWMRAMNTVCDACIARLVVEEKLVLVSDHAFNWAETVGIQSSSLSMRKFAQDYPEEFAKMHKDAIYRKTGYYPDKDSE